MPTDDGGESHMPPKYSVCFVAAASAAILFVSTVFTACESGSTADGADQNNAGAPILSELANATYEGIFDEPVRLAEGRWEGAPYVEGGASRPSAGLVDDFVLTGDLDGDGREDAAVLIWESSGGSGTRSYLAVAGRVDGAVTNLATDLVGDRVQVKNGFIANGLIVLDLIQTGPGDAACCPTRKARVEWRLVDGTLARTATRDTGTLSLEDLYGPEWVLVRIGQDIRTRDASRATLTFDAGRVTGNGGCNGFFGTVTGEAPGKLGFSAMGTTMRACPEPDMDFERRYLRALAGGSNYSFIAGRLVLDCRTEDGMVSMVFERDDVAK